MFLFEEQVDLWKEVLHKILRRCDHVTEVATDFYTLLSASEGLSLLTETCNGLLYNVENLIQMFSI